MGAARQLARRFRRSHIRAIERAQARVAGRLDRELGRDAGDVTFDLDATDTEVCGHNKRGAACSRAGARAYNSYVVANTTVPDANAEQARRSQDPNSAVTRTAWLPSGKMRLMEWVEYGRRFGVIGRGVGWQPPVTRALRAGRRASRATTSSS